MLQANCPSCAASIEFKAGSTIVLVCPYCRSAIARTDRGLQDLGKVAEIVESEVRTSRPVVAADDRVVGVDDEELGVQELP